MIKQRRPWQFWIHLHYHLSYEQPTSRHRDCRRKCPCSHRGFGVPVKQLLLQAVRAQALRFDRRRRKRGRESSSVTFSASARGRPKSSGVAQCVTNYKPRIHRVTEPKTRLREKNRSRPSGVPMTPRVSAKDFGKSKVTY